MVHSTDIVSVVREQQVVQMSSMQLVPGWHASDECT